MASAAVSNFALLALLFIVGFSTWELALTLNVEEGKTGDDKIGLAESPL